MIVISLIFISKNYFLITKTNSAWERERERERETVDEDVGTDYSNVKSRQKLPKI